MTILTFDFIKKNFIYSETETLPIGTHFLHSDPFFKYYKVTVAKGTRMKVGQTVKTCEKAGLKAVCPGDKHCKYTNGDASKCVVTPLSVDPFKDERTHRYGCGRL